jgi:chromosome segregation ATPase
MIGTRLLSAFLLLLGCTVGTAQEERPSLQSTVEKLEQRLRSMDEYLQDRQRQEAASREATERRVRELAQQLAEAQDRARALESLDRRLDDFGARLQELQRTLEQRGSAPARELEGLRRTLARRDEQLARQEQRIAALADELRKARAAPRESAPPAAQEPAPLRELRAELVRLQALKEQLEQELRAARAGR